MTSSNFSHQVLELRQFLLFFALSLTRNRPDAEDLVQETFMKAILNKNRYSDNTNLKAWLFTIMKNIFINNYRRKVKARTIFDDSKDGYLINFPKITKLPDPETQINSQELYKGIEDLGHDYRVPLKMYFEGYKYKEIADALNLPIGTVKSRIFLARKHLISRFKEFSNQL